MTSQVLEGAILAIGIAYVKVSPFLPEVRHTHTHTHTQTAREEVRFRELSRGMSHSAL